MDVYRFSTTRGFFIFFRGSFFSPSEIFRFTILRQGRSNAYIHEELRQSDLSSPDGDSSPLSNLLSILNSDQDLRNRYQASLLGEVRSVH